MKFNRMIERMGVNVDYIECMIRRTLSKYSDPESALIATVVLEELTGTGARFIRKYGDTLLSGADPTVGELWMWHAMEEIEHVHVARQLLKVVGPSKFKIARVTAVMLLDFAKTLRFNYREISEAIERK